MQLQNSDLAWKVNVILAVIGLDKQAIADKLKLHRSIVTNVLNGKSRSRRHQRVIANAISAEVEKILIDSPSDETTKA